MFQAGEIQLDGNTAKELGKETIRLLKDEASSRIPEAQSRARELSIWMNKEQGEEEIWETMESAYVQIVWCKGDFRNDHLNQDMGEYVKDSWDAIHSITEQW